MTNPRLPSLFAILALVAPAACGKKADEADNPAPVAPELPAPPVLKEGRGPWVLRYFSPTSGELIVTREVSAVPEAARKQVLVVPDDPALQGPWLFVADLSAKKGDHYPVRVVDRYELERERSESAPTRTAESMSRQGAALQQARDEQVILYRTSWCGYCEKAGEYLRLKGVKFVSKDIERDPEARRDMLARARKAGVPPSRLGGVPILYIKGRILTGFNRDAIDRALGG